MSWYVRYLLLNSKEIRERVMNPLNVGFTDSTIDGDIGGSDYSDPDDVDEYVSAETSNPEDDDFFNDLLIVEREINELIEKGVLSGRDSDLIETMSSDPTISKLSTPLGSGRFSIVDRFNLIINLVSKSIGGMFTDDGYVEYLTDKYKLDPRRVEILKQFIANNVRI